MKKVFGAVRRHRSTNNEPITWTTQAGPIGETGVEIIYGNGVWVLATLRHIYTSVTSPITPTWVLRYTVPNNFVIESMAFDGNITWAACGNNGSNGVVITATNPEGTWVNHFNATLFPLSITYGNNLWVLGNYPFNTSNMVYTTADPASTWTAVSGALTAGELPYYLVFGNNYYAIAGRYTFYATTTPTVAPWSQQGISYPNLSQNLAYGNNYFATSCASNSGDLFYTDTPTLNLHSTTIGNSARTITALGYGNNAWCFGCSTVSTEGCIVTAPNITGPYTLRASNLFSLANPSTNIRYYNGIWVALANTTGEYATAIPGV